MGVNMQTGFDFELLMPYATVMTSTHRLWLSRLIEWQKLDVTLAKFARDHDYSYLLINRWKRWSTQKAQALGLFSVIEKPELNTPLFYKLEPSAPHGITPLSLSFKLPNGIECQMVSDPRQAIAFIQGLATL